MRETQTKMENRRNNDAREDGGSWELGRSFGGRKEREESREGESKDSDNETTTYQVGRYLLDIITNYGFYIIHAYN